MKNHSFAIAHHFASAAAQRESAKLGLWIFLVTEVLLFGGLFVAYAVYRAWNPEMFFRAHKALDTTLGAANTLILITSSLTMALAIRSIRSAHRGHAALLLALTLFLAAGFLGIKYLEYGHKFQLGQLPGRYYAYTGIEGKNPQIFFGFYFAMTGLHAVHVVAGMLAIGWLLRQTVRGKFSSEYYTPAELVGLYWHFVDMVWIFLFPLLYLIG